MAVINAKVVKLADKGEIVTDGGYTDRTVRMLVIDDEGKSVIIYLTKDEIDDLHDALTDALENEA